MNTFGTKNERVLQDKIYHQVPEDMSSHKKLFSIDCFMKIGNKDSIIETEIKQIQFNSYL